VLVVVALLLWLVALGEAILGLVWIRHLEFLSMQLPSFAIQIIGTCKWVNNYWWIVLVAAIVAVPVLTWLTSFVFSRVHNPAGRWLWGALLIVPPLVFLVMLRWSMWVTEVKALEGLRNPPDPLESYYNADGLMSPLVLREGRQSPNGIVVETLRITPSGRWSITRERPGQLPELARQGEMRQEQLYLLGRHLALVDAGRRLNFWAGGPPEREGDFLLSISGRLNG
jgi:hypothetical protein